MSERLLTAPEVAELLAVRESWVREATRQGHLPHLRLGRYVRYEREAIMEWLEKQRVEPGIVGTSGQVDLPSVRKRACD